MSIVNCFDVSFFVYSSFVFLCALFYCLYTERETTHRIPHSGQNKLKTNNQTSKFIVWVIYLRKNKLSIFHSKCHEIVLCIFMKTCTHKCRERLQRSFHFWHLFKTSMQKNKTKKKVKKYKNFL